MSGALWRFPATTTHSWWLDVDDYESIDLGFSAMIAYDPLRTAERLELGHGYGEHFLHGGGQKVHIAYSMGENEDLADEHVALVSALREGKPVSFSQSLAETWAVPLTDPDRGETALVYPATNPFAAYDGITNPLANDHVLIQSPLPELRREIIDIGSVNTGTATVTFTTGSTNGGLVYGYTTQEDVVLRPWIRPLYFFPFVRLIPGQRAILRQEQGMPWTFDAWFLCDIGLEQDEIGGAT